MSIQPSEIEKIATLSRIRIANNEVEEVAQRINDILSMVDKMQGTDTRDVEPMANPLDAKQRLRPDTVTETDQHERFLALAPDAQDNLYLVPKVIE